MQKSKIFLLTLSSTFLLSACGEDVYPEDHNSPQTARKIYITREYQRVHRFNCSNELQSNKIETVKSPTKAIDIKPMSNKQITHSNFYNTSTGSGSGSIWSYVGVTLDMARAVFTMKVQRGLNTISYEFKLCEHKDTEGNCTDFSEESGDFYIDVDYSEVQLDGVKEIHPSEEDCIANTTTTTTNQ